MNQESSFFFNNDFQIEDKLSGVSREVDSVPDKRLTYKNVNLQSSIDLTFKSPLDSIRCSSVMFCSHSSTASSIITYSIIESVSDDLVYEKTLLRRQLQKTALVFTIAFCFIYLMTLEMVLIDNRSLEYVYGVTNPVEWEYFAEAVTNVNIATNDEGPFPIALLRPSFGGVGYGDVLVKFPLEMNISNVYNGGILLPMDVVISSTQNLYIEWRAVADTIVVVFFVITAMFVISIPYLWRRRVKENYFSSLVLLRRLIAIVGLNYFFRGCVLGLTILPPGSLACIPKLRYSLWEKITSPFWLIAGVEACCYDFMYSGHTSLTTVLIWFWVLYLPGVVVNLNRGRFFTTISVRILGALLIFLIICALTLSRLHYSIDVALGLFIGSATFWSWHTTLCFYHYSRLFDDGSNLLSSFQWIVNCIGWLDGIDRALLPTALKSNVKRQIYLSGGESLNFHQNQIKGDSSSQSSCQFDTFKEENDNPHKEEKQRAIDNSCATSSMASNAKSRYSFE